MIYTVTFNPAIDYIVSMEELKQGTVNRTDSEQEWLRSAADPADHEERCGLSAAEGVLQRNGLF